MTRRIPEPVFFFFVSMIGALCVQAGDLRRNVNSNSLVSYSHRDVKKLGDYIASKVLHDPSEASIFYSLKDHRVITEMMPRPWIKGGGPLRLPFIGDPCSCSGSSCGCCVGINITAIKFDKQACVNVTYEQSILGIIVDVYIDNYNILHNVYSAANPPPLCIPLIISGVPTGIDFCLRLYQIFLTGYNVHVCIDLEARIVSSPILILHFDCVVLGLDGVSIVKPNATSTVSPSDENFEEIETSSPSVNGDIFDPVSEDSITTTSLAPSDAMETSSMTSNASSQSFMMESSLMNFTNQSIDQVTTQKNPIQIIKESNPENIHFIPQIIIDDSFNITLVAKYRENKKNYKKAGKEI